MEPSTIPLLHQQKAVDWCLDVLQTCFIVPFAYKLAFYYLSLDRRRLRGSAQLPDRTGQPGESGSAPREQPQVVPGWTLRRISPRKVRAVMVELGKNKSPFSGSFLACTFPSQLGWWITGSSCWKLRACSGKRTGTHFPSALRRSEAEQGF